MFHASNSEVLLFLEVFFFICLFGEFSVSIFGWLVGFFAWLQHTEWLKQNKRKSQNIPIKFAAPMGLEDLG